MAQRTNTKLIVVAGAAGKLGPLVIESLLTYPIEPENMAQAISRGAL